MGNYYKIGEEIVESDVIPNSDMYIFTTLTPEQVDFMKSNNQVSVEEIMNCKLNIKPFDLNQEIANKYLEVAAVFEQQLSEGYLDEVLNIRVKIHDEDRLQFSHLLLQLDNAEKLSASLDTVNIVDYDGEIRQLTSLEFRQLILRYGMYYMQLWGNKVTKDKMISMCTTQQELEALVW